jgi:hypothetical protein
MSSITINPHVQNKSTPLNKKQDKIPIKTIEGSGEIIVNPDTLTIIDVIDNTIINLNDYDNDGFTHSYEIILNYNSESCSIEFPNSIKWVKDIELINNHKYHIIIDNDVAMWTSVNREE